MAWSSGHLGKGCHKLLAVLYKIVLKRLFEIVLLGSNILTSCFLLTITTVEKNVPLYGTQILKETPPFLIYLDFDHDRQHNPHVVHL